VCALTRAAPAKEELSSVESGCALDLHALPLVTSCATPVQVFPCIQDAKEARVLVRAHTHARTHTHTHCVRSGSRLLSATHMHTRTYTLCARSGLRSLSALQPAYALAPCVCVACSPRRAPRVARARTRKCHQPQRRHCASFRSRWERWGLQVV